ncbi:MAG TPA: hypothetical protein VMF89_29170, partial [Polyangiales bacterium]|nr:hypothetical protein [Polyangiales bacterium]
NADSDEDGLPDGREVLELDTDPKNADSDEDGLSDGTEVSELDTDPKNADTDDDGLSDGREVSELDTDPKNADGDNDGLSDGREVSLNTDPSSPDSDGDGLSDGQEVLELRTDPENADSDGDGLSDGEEVLVLGTNALSVDTDGDGITDGGEADRGTDPLKPTADPSEGYELRGGSFGCSTAVSPQRTALGVWLFGLCVLALCIRRSRTRRSALLLVVMAYFAPAPAHAQNQGFSLNNLDVSERGAEWFAADSLDLRGHGRVALGVLGEWAYRPLVVFDRNNEERVRSIVRNQFVLHPGASVVLWDRLRLALDLPLQLYADGNDALARGTTYLAPADTVSLGDLRLGAAARL